MYHKSAVAPLCIERTHANLATTLAHAARASALCRTMVLGIASIMMTVLRLAITIDVNNKSKKGQVLGQVWDLLQGFLVPVMKLSDSLGKS